MTVTTIIKTSYSNHAHSTATACDRYEIDKHICMRISVAVHLVTSRGRFEVQLSNYATRSAIIRESNINSLMVPDQGKYVTVIKRVQPFETEIKIFVG